MSERLPAAEEEIAKLFEIADRELADAAVPGLSSDGQFEHAYTAALALATVAVRGQGIRTRGPDHHRKTLEAFSDAQRGRWSELAEYLQHCRRRRNTIAYDRAGAVSHAEADELRTRVAELRSQLRS